MMAHQVFELGSSLHFFYVKEKEDILTSEEQVSVCRATILYIFLLI